MTIPEIIISHADAAVTMTAAKVMPAVKISVSACSKEPKQAAAVPRLVSLPPMTAITEMSASSSTTAMAADANPTMTAAIVISAII